MGRAVLVETLLSGLRDLAGRPLASGKVYAYGAGTLVAKDLYTTIDKSGLAASPLILDAYGRSKIYADGYYKFIVKDSADTTLYTWDNLPYFFQDALTEYGGTSSGAANVYTVSLAPAPYALLDGMKVRFRAHQTNTSTTPTLNPNGLGAITMKDPGGAALTAGAIVSGYEYEAAYTSASGGGFLVTPYVTNPTAVVTTEAQLVAAESASSNILVAAPITLTASRSITKSIEFLRGCAVTTNAYTLTLSGQVKAGLYQIFATGANVSGLKVGYPEWWGAARDGTTNDASAIQAAINATGSNARVELAPGTYKLGAQLTIPITYDYFTLNGYGAKFLGAFNGVLLKISDTTTTNDHATYITIQGLTIEGSGDTDTTYASQTAIEIDAIIGCYLRDVTIVEIPNIGIVGTKSAASGSQYWNKVVFENVAVRFCGFNLVYVGTGSAGDDLTCVNCLFNHGGSQVSTNSPDGAVHINVISLSMHGIEVSGTYSATTAGAGYRWGMLINNASGVLAGMHWELNGNNQAGSGDLLLDTNANGLMVLGSNHYTSDTTGAKYAIITTSKDNVIDGVVWAGNVTHTYDYIVNANGATNIRIGSIRDIGSAGPNVAVLNINSGFQKAIEVKNGDYFECTRRREKYQTAYSASSPAQVALNANWGTTASVGSVSAYDSHGDLRVSSAGTGQAANATITITFADGAWPVAPTAHVQQRGGTSLGAITWTCSTSALTITVPNAPVAGQNYDFCWSLIGM